MTSPYLQIGFIPRNFSRSFPGYIFWHIFCSCLLQNASDFWMKFFPTGCNFCSFFWVHQFCWINFRWRVYAVYVQGFFFSTSSNSSIGQQRSNSIGCLRPGKKRQCNVLQHVDNCSKDFNLKTHGGTSNEKFSKPQVRKLNISNVTEQERALKNNWGVS